MAHSSFRPAALAALLAPAVAFGQVTMTSTPAGNVFDEWPSSFNAADPNRIAEFQRSYDRQTPVMEVREQRKETGGYKLVGMEAATPR